MGVRDIMARAGLTTERVIAAAVDLIDEVGYDGLTLSALARSVDVKVASLYAHVGGLADLRVGVSAVALDELADLAAAALAGRSGKDALVAFAAGYRDYARAHPGRYAATRTEVPANSPALAAGRRHAELTRTILRGYDLDETHQVHAIRLIGSMLHGFIDLELSGSFDHSEPPSQDTWGAILDVLDAALGSWTARH